MLFFEKPKQRKFRTKQGWREGFTDSRCFRNVADADACHGGPVPYSCSN